MKHKLITTLLATAFSLSTANAANSNLIAGYLDATATGSALKVNLNDANKDGYNMVIFGFAKVSGTKIDFYNESVAQVATAQNNIAQQLAMTTLVSIGGQVNTFNPGELNVTELETLAQNIVTFIQTNHFAGIDFDIEVKTDAAMLKTLISHIKHLAPAMIIAAAPQINNGRLVTTGDNEDYRDTIDAGLFDYLFLQEYNTQPQNQSSYISSIYPTIKAQVPANTKLVIGEPSAAVAAGLYTIYHPSADETLTTEQATAKMLPELKKINQDPQYAGVMGWSLNVDYSAADYADPEHTPGSYAYGLKDCVINNQCDNPPAPKPTVPNFTLQTSNTDTSKYPLGIMLEIKDSEGNTFSSDYLAPNSYKIYNKGSNPSATVIEGKKNLKVYWSTYAGGPSGVCPNSFDLTKNMHIMVNATYKSCDFKAL